MTTATPAIENITGITADTAVEEGKIRKNKPPFDVLTAVDAAGNSICNEDNLLTGVPVFQEDDTRRPKRTDFLNISLYLTFKASLMTKTIDGLTTKRDQMLHNVSRLADIGDEHAQAAAMRLARMASALEEAKKIMAQDGQDPEALIRLFNEDL